MRSLGSLRFVYTGSHDVDADARYHVETLGGELRWLLDRFGARAACVRHGNGPDMVFTSHLPKGDQLHLFECKEPSAFADLVDARRVATPVGPAVVFQDAIGRRIGAIRTRSDDYLEKAWRDPNNPGAVVPKFSAEL